MDKIEQILLRLYDGAREDEQNNNVLDGLEKRLPQAHSAIISAVCEEIEKLKKEEKIINIERADEPIYVEGEEHNQAIDDIVAKLKGGRK